LNRYIKKILFFDFSDLFFGFGNDCVVHFQAMAHLLSKSLHARQMGMGQMHRGMDL